MPTHVTERDEQGVGEAAKDVAERVSTIVRLELELAALELKQKLTALGIGIGLGVGAAVLSLFFVGFVFATIAAALALIVPWWAALLIVSGIILALMALLVFLAVNRIQKGSPPVPEQAILEAKLTTEALKSDGSRV
jgi:Putative Actinobacterial Holin-X, holin superfamily III